MSIGLALGGLVGLAALCTLFAVISSALPTGSAWTAPAYYGVNEPFRGATTSFGGLGSRDAVRAVGSFGNPLVPDPVTARRGLSAALALRGYVASESPESALAQMPFEITPADLDGSCGLVVITGDVGALVQRAGIVGGDSFVAVDPSAFTVATCRATPVRVEGIGGATVQTWLFPGLTEGARAASSLSADAFLAHAEAETFLRRLGYEPVDEVIEVLLSATASVEAPYRPATGCVPFVAYVEGAGRAALPSGTTDYLSDRALSSAIGCASGSGWELTAVDDATPGGRAFLRAYRAGSGPTTAMTAGSMRLTDLAHATWPAPIAEAVGP